MSIRLLLIKSKIVLLIFISLMCVAPGASQTQKDALKDIWVNQKNSDSLRFNAIEDRFTENYQYA